MPKARIKPSPAPDTTDLERRLLDEWQSPSDAEDAPIIIEDEVATEPWRILRLYVIWEAWRALEVEQRAAVLDRVLEQLGRSPEDVEATSVVFGLTPQEASSLGIEYEIVQPAP